MAVSYNEDVRIGGSTFHVQTEYYKKSGKVVSNIFKDGHAIKRLEREVEEGADVESAVGEFHRYVVERLKGGAAKKGGEEKGFSLTKEIEKKLLETVTPYFGVATSFILEEALSSSKTAEEFVEHLLDGLPEEERKQLEDKISPLLSSASDEKSEETAETETLSELTPEKEEKIIGVLSEYVGIMASPILEESLEEWSGKSYQELVEIIVSHLDSDKEREELYQRLMFL